MTESAGIEPNLMETYNQRMSEIQDVSDVIAVANMQLNKILSQFGWSKKSLLKSDDLETCPLDENHHLHEDNLQSHIQKCNFRKHKIISVNDKDIPLPPLYDSGSATVPFLVSKAQYKKIGVQIEELCTTQKINDELLEEDEGINDYKPCNSLDELRFIYSWHKIPKSYIILDVARIPKDELNSWLVENTLNLDLSNNMKSGLVNSMFAWLSELPTPSQIMSYVEDFLGENSTAFVLRLWKFLAAKCLCLNQQIPEHTRNEFDFYTTTSMNNQPFTIKDDGVIVKKQTIEHVRPVLPMEWVFYNLTAEQKLAIYDDVCKSYKLLRKPSFGISDLQLETQEQVKMLTEFDEFNSVKTHMEILAELRDYKRRRQTYRGKNKNTMMSAISVIRELFNQQMLYLKLIHENQKQQEEAENEKKIQECRSKSRSVSPTKKLSRRSRDERKDDDHRRSMNRSRDYRRSHSRSRSCSRDRRRRSRSRDPRSRSRSRDRHHRSKKEHRRERSREKYRRHDSRERRVSKEELSNKTYY